MIGPVSDVRIYRPADIAVLQTAFDRACTELKIDTDSSEAATLAARMFRLFAEGCRDVDTIVSSLKQTVA